MSKVGEFNIEKPRFLRRGFLLINQMSVGRERRPLQKFCATVLRGWSQRKSDKHADREDREQCCPTLPASDADADFVVFVIELE